MEVTTSDLSYAPLRARKRSGDCGKDICDPYDSEVLQTSTEEAGRRVPEISAAAFSGKI